MWFSDILGALLIHMHYFQVHFEDDARGKYLELLGYKKEELAIKVILIHTRDIINT